MIYFCLREARRAPREFFGCSQVLTHALRTPWVAFLCLRDVFAVVRLIIWWPKSSMMLLRPLSVIGMARSTDMLPRSGASGTQPEQKNIRHMISRPKIARGIHFCGLLVLVLSASCSKRGFKSSSSKTSKYLTIVVSSVLQGASSGSAPAPTSSSPTPTK